MSIPDIPCCFFTDTNQHIMAFHLHFIVNIKFILKNTELNQNSINRLFLFTHAYDLVEFKK